MAKKSKILEVPPTPAAGSRPRLVKLIIKNFRCIGSTPVAIDLDDIVVLVGPNNVGKSSVLKAYEVIMSEGSSAGHLSIEDFPAGKVNPDALPEIELHTVVYDNSPGPEWMERTEAGDLLVKELWRWSTPGAPVRRGYNVQEHRWANDDDKEKVPWGAAGVANSRRPQPHRVDAFASPDEQAAEIVALLMAAIRERVKAHQADSKTNNESDIARLLAGIASLQKKIVTESQEQITAIQNDLSGYISRVFPGHSVVFDAKPEDDVDKALNLFKANPQLLMGPIDGYQSAIGRQGSGARRTLLWAAIRLLAETGKKKTDQTQRPHILLLDEPEICLHPSAVREACDLLYSLPALTGSWQVMVTTHSPVFIDFWRDNTSIVRVERQLNGCASGTTIYRPRNAALSDDDKDCLKLLNLCDPYVAEFFFGGRTIVVEGDTEYTAFTYVMQREPERFNNVHIVRARGKATIISLCKVLNQFGTPYSVLHDSDRPTTLRKKKVFANPAWALNGKIFNQVKEHLPAKKVRLVASLVSFEPAYFGFDVSVEKPITAWVHLKNNQDACDRVTALLDSLVDFNKPLPVGALEWSDLSMLESQLPVEQA